MKQKAIASKAGYFVGILKKFKAGEFTTGEAQKVQAKRTPKQTSADDLKNKTAKIAEKNRKLILNENATKTIEIINKAETKADLHKIYSAISGKFSGGTADIVMEKWSKRYNEVRA